MEKQELKELLERYAAGNCTDEEITWVENWYLQEDNIFPLDLTEQEISDDLAQVQFALPVQDSSEIRPKIGWPKIAAAAALVLITAGTIYWSQPKADRQQIVKIQTLPVSQDIMPGGAKAILTLDDGAQISLTDATLGEIAQQSGTAIVKTGDGTLSYRAASANTQAKIQYNTIRTPVGGQYQLTLADGTRVWLNAASSLRFPTAFSGTDRSVELQGEAYFEVAKSKGKTFKVLSHLGHQDQEIEVLGTHFNINTYTADRAETTLFEGLVKVNASGSGRIQQSSVQFKSEILKPGQQSVLGSQRLKVQQADLDAVLAWKKGYFTFNQSNIRTVMEEMERWYDIEIKIQDDMDDLSIVGSFPRSYKLSEAIHLMELTGNFKFKIKGRRLEVMR